LQLLIRHFLIHARTVLPAVAVVLSAVAVAAAQGVSLPRQHHAWGRFLPGSWSKVRKLSEELDERGNVKTASTTETKTTLTEVDSSGCTVRLEVTVEVAGKRFTAQPRVVRLGYNGETNGEAAELRQKGKGELEIGGKSVSCDILEATINGGDNKVVSTLYYSATLPPFVLKRETRATDAAGARLQRRTEVDVIAVDMPHKVLAEVKTASYIRTIDTHAQGSTFTMEVFCVDVPGGVVAHTSKELDVSGKPIRRSTLELLDYGVAQPPRPVGRRLFFFRHHHSRTVPYPR
jgi:hypothetical protein